MLTPSFFDADETLLWIGLKPVKVTPAIVGARRP